MDAQATIWTAIKAANQAWLGGDAQGVASLFHEDVVMFSPRGEVLVRGRDAMVESYDAYHRRARTLAFDEFDHEVNVFGDTARASYRFRIAYELDGHKHEETGREVMVFTRQDGTWRAILRMNLPAV